MHSKATLYQIPATTPWEPLPRAAAIPTGTLVHLTKIRFSLEGPETIPRAQEAEKATPKGPEERKRSSGPKGHKGASLGPAFLQEILRDIALDS